MIRQAWRESGFWRLGAGQDDVEVVLAANTGEALVYTGVAGDQRWEIGTVSAQGTPTAKVVDGERRLYALVDDALVYASELAPHGRPLAAHLNARLTRVRCLTSQAGGDGSESSSPSVSPAARAVRSMISQVCSVSCAGEFRARHVGVLEPPRRGAVDHADDADDDPLGRRGVEFEHRHVAREQRGELGGERRLGVVGGGRAGVGRRRRRAARGTGTGSGAPRPSAGAGRSRRR